MRVGQCFIQRESTVSLEGFNFDKRGRMASRAVVATDLQSSPQDWKIVTKEKPRASPGHVVVHITLRPVNPTDVLAPKLYLGHLEGKENVIGSEAVGYVEEVGEGVTKVKVGKRVVPSFLSEFYKKGNGSWQDYVEISEDEIYFIPDSLSDEIAAQFIINPWTVYALLKQTDVPKGEYLLSNAAGSVLGRQLIQLAKHWGIKTINVVRRDELKEELKALGADEVINSSKEDLVARVKEITGGKGAYSAVDPVAGKQTKTIVATVRDGGKVFLYGAMDSFEATINVFELGRVELKFGGLFPFLKGPAHMQAVSDEVGRLLEEKVMVPLTGKTFKFEDFKEALLEADKPSRGGKILMGT